jgi:Family of unknown function (DUF6256)
VLRAILPPLITAYALFVAMVVLGRRRPVARPIARPHGRGNGAARVRLRRVVWTIVGGYAAFLVIVLIFHVWLAEEPDAFASAVWGGAFLSGITLVVAAGSSLLGR